MQRVKNAICLSILLLAGCSANSPKIAEAPAPLAESENATTVSPSVETTTATPSIVGIWKLSNRMREETYTFKEDGTYQVVLKAKPDPQVRGMIVEGTYEMASPSTIQFYVQGKPTNLEQIRWKGNAFEMQKGGNWLEWQRSQ